MSIRTRALIFSTFLGCCLAIALLLIALTTNNWVRATPRRGNATESLSEVSLGLFYGNKNLNHGIGMRNHPVNVYTFIQNEPDTMNFWLWLFTALGTGFGLLACAVAAIGAVLKSASAAKKRGTMILLFASNISSAAGQIIAFICWLVQFYQYLTHNVLAYEDTRLHWYSEGLAELGYSFYLVIASTLVVLLNIVILIYVRRQEYRERHGFEPPSEDKNQSAIMLY